MTGTHKMIEQKINSIIVHNKFPLRTVVRNAILIVFMLFTAPACTAGIEGDGHGHGNILDPYSYGMFDGEEKAKKALESMFQPGSAVDGFVGYIEKSGGKCSQKNNAYECRYVRRYYIGTFVFGMRAGGETYETKWYIKILVEKGKILNYDLDAQGPTRIK